MLRAVNLFTLAQRLKALESGSEEQPIQPMDPKGQVGDVITEGWNFIGSLYYNLFHSHFNAVYPETAQLIVDKTAGKDDFELVPESRLVESYVQFLSYLGAAENYLADCWAIVGLGLHLEDEAAEPQT